LLRETRLALRGMRRRSRRTFGGFVYTKATVYFVRELATDGTVPLAERY
jgi:hypothetical protein